MANDKLKVCFLGDGLISGVGDSRFLGWTGRLMQRTTITNPFLTSVEAYELGKKGDNSKQIAERLKTEALPRFDRDSVNRLVIAMSNNDLPNNTPSEKSIGAEARKGVAAEIAKTYLRNMIEDVVAATVDVEVLVIGPPPGQIDQENAIAMRNEYFADTCSRMGVQYVDIFRPLKQNQQWMTSLFSTGENYPDQIGYGLIAWVVAHSNWEGFLEK